jgi:hypothetical protein
MTTQVVPTRLHRRIHNPTLLPRNVPTHVSAPAVQSTVISYTYIIAVSSSIDSSKIIRLKCRWLGYDKNDPVTSSSYLVAPAVSQDPVSAGSEECRECCARSDMPRLGDGNAIDQCYVWPYGLQERSAACSGEGYVCLFARRAPSVRCVSRKRP